MLRNNSFRKKCLGNIENVLEDTTHKNAWNIENMLNETCEDEHGIRPEAWQQLYEREEPYSHIHTSKTCKL